MSFIDGPAPLSPPTRHRSTRDRPAKAPLSEDAVVDAALAILKSKGLESVTMRSVAAALDTGAASLYVYVAGREGLLEAMLDRVIATVRLEDPDPLRWRAQLHSLLGRLRQALVAHPGIASVTLANPPSTASILALTENLLGMLLAAGLEPQDAAWGCDTLVLITTGSAREDASRRPRRDLRRTRVEEHQKSDELYKVFAALPADRFPLITSHAHQLVAGDRDERFRFAIDIAIDGLIARKALPQQGGERP